MFELKVALLDTMPTMHSSELPGCCQTLTFLLLLQTYGDQSDSEKITLTHSFSLHKHI